MCSIRKYDKKDKQRVEEICLSTSSCPAREKALMQEALLEVFCRYYIEQEPDNCFVAADEQDEAVGYVLCAKDFTSWEERFHQFYLESSRNPITKLMGQGTVEGLKEFHKEYPAHLHIDIDPKYQRHGLGTRMMDALVKHLRECGVPGVMLCVASDNEKGQNFYRKYGFKELSAGEQEITMGLKTDAE